MNKKLLLGLGTSVFAISPAISIVSCSDSLNEKTNVKEVKFATNVEKITKANNEVANVNIYDANNNTNAINEIQKYVNNLTVKQLNRDFSYNPNPSADADEKNEGVLTQFYKVLENETKDIEVEVKSINVKSKNDDGSFQIAVTMEVENETKDNEKNVTKEIKWTPKLTFISQNDVKKIKTDTNNFTSIKTNDGVDIDLSDLKELFLGENDDEDGDDIGIFDLLAKINKANDNLGQLVAYELTLNDLKPAFDEVLKPNQKVAIDVNTKFLVPSISLNSNESIVLTPNKTPEINVPNVSTKLDSAAIDALIQANPSAIDRLNQDNQPNNKFTELLNNFVDSSTIKPDILEKISSIQIIKDQTTNKYAFLITYTNSKQMPDAFIITPKGLEITKPIVSPTK